MANNTRKSKYPRRIPPSPSTSSTKSSPAPGALAAAATPTLLAAAAAATPTSLAAAPFARHHFDCPDDVLIEILKRLPLKDLVQFTCVCKAWQSLITSCTFVHVHALFNVREATSDFTNPNYCSQLFKEPVNVHANDSGVNLKVYSADNFDGKTDRCLDINSPDAIGKKHFVVCYGEGVLCFFDFYSANPVAESLMLWNPSIRKGIEVPAPDDGVLELTVNGFPKLLFGFGYDNVVDDYVVVRVAYFTGGGCMSGEIGSTVMKADVYEVQMKKWTSLESVTVLHYFSTIRWRGVGVNGVIHWVANLVVKNDEKDGVHKSILTFQSWSNVFGVIDLPKEVVAVLGDFVKVVNVPRSGKEVLGVGHCSGNVFGLWVMQDMQDGGAANSWVKMFTFDLGSTIRNDMNVVVFNDGLVALKKYVTTANEEHTHWVSYDCGTLHLQYLIEISKQFDYVDRYAETLVLLGQKERVLPWKPPVKPVPELGVRIRVGKGNFVGSRGGDAGAGTSGGAGTGGGAGGGRGGGRGDREGRGGRRGRGRPRGRGRR